jgi:hypothetical protein
MGWGAMRGYHLKGFLEEILSKRRRLSLFPGFADRDWPVNTPDSTVFEWVTQVYNSHLEEFKEAIADVTCWDTEVLEGSGRVAVLVSLTTCPFVGIDLHLLEKLKESGSGLLAPVEWVFRSLQGKGLYWDQDLLSGEIEYIASGCEIEGGSPSCSQCEEFESSCEAHATWLEQEQGKANRWYYRLACLESNFDIGAWLEEFVPKGITEQRLCDLISWLYEEMESQNGFSLTDISPEIEQLEDFYPNGEALPFEGLRFIWNAVRVHNPHVAPSLDSRVNEIGLVPAGVLLSPMELTADRLQEVDELLTWAASFISFLEEFSDIQYRMLNDL